MNLFSQPRSVWAVAFACVVAFSALAGSQGSIAEIVGFRAGWMVDAKQPVVERGADSWC